MNQYADDYTLRRLPLDSSSFPQLASSTEGGFLDLWSWSECEYEYVHPPHLHPLHRIRSFEQRIASLMISPSKVCPMKYGWNLRFLVSSWNHCFALLAFAETGIASGFAGCYGGIALFKPGLGVCCRPYPSLDLLSLIGFRLLLFKV